MTAQIADALVRVSCPVANFSEKRQIDIGEGGKSARAVHDILIAAKSKVILNGAGLHVALLQTRAKAGAGRGIPVLRFVPPSWSYSSPGASAAKGSGLLKETRHRLRRRGKRTASRPSNRGTRPTIPSSQDGLSLMAPASSATPPRPGSQPLSRWRAWRTPSVLAAGRPALSKEVSANPQLRRAPSRPSSDHLTSIRAVRCAQIAVIARRHGERVKSTPSGPSTNSSGSPLSAGMLRVRRRERKWVYAGSITCAATCSRRPRTAILLPPPIARSAGIVITRSKSPETTNC